ncbi:MAG: cytochrome c oxidase assembly protein [Actinobacteria bacterium]|nr:cytochrome c oxidase assembly protein [Actinomycetota bacterium]
MRAVYRVFVLAGLIAIVFPQAALAHGDEVARGDLASAWRLDAPLLAAAVVATALFAQAFVRLRRRGRSDHAGAGRALLFGLGLAAMVGALASPLDAIGEEYLLSGHMLQHMLIADAAPALLLLALRGPLLFFYLPARVLGPLARAGALRRALAALSRPPVALGIWVAVFAAWHVPEAYELALRHGAVHQLEHLSFALAGTLVWLQLVDPARRGELTAARRVGFALCVFAAGQVLADVLIFSFGDLYPVYAAQDERLFGLSVHSDQQLAGAVMMVEQLLTLGTCAALLLVLGRHPLGGGRLAAGLRP